MEKTNTLTKMTKTEHLNQVREEYRLLVAWADKFGGSYAGGGGGVGHVHQSEFSCVIYFQAENGSKNYHPSEDLPEGLRKLLNNASKAYASQILAKAREMMLHMVRAAAEEAIAEAEEVLRLAKSEPPSDHEHR